MNTTAGVFTTSATQLMRGLFMPRIIAGTPAVPPLPTSTIRPYGFRGQAGDAAAPQAVCGLATVEQQISRLDAASGLVTVTPAKIATAWAASNPMRGW
ncbi:hypothetical protein F7R01_07445 [Pseudomonas argentinensis]|uniref:hypothetical protein n=1 Tax=Phytopseudomonas argentinensis TaxID=289370 RepID=UPI0009436DEB|nr:hypothetical protein [Pseudomonas argentinensis]KAB0551023.1 hypothetical protein F7R01_07445 [Pseudomonas argentinensis]